MSKKMRKLFIIAAFSLCLVAADNDDDRKTWAIWQEIGALTNCDAGSINAAVNCGGDTGVRVEGYNTLVFEIFYDYAAGTGWEFYLETCYEGQATTDCTDDADWHVVAIEFPSGSTVQLTPGKVYRTVSADDYLTWSISGGYKRIRLRDMVATGSPTSSDKITVNLRALYIAP